MAEVGREAVKEIEEALRGLEQAMQIVKTERAFQLDEIKGMIARLTSEVQNLYMLIRDGTNGRKALLDRVRDLERDMLESKAGLRDSRGIKIENLRGQWALWPVVITSLLGTAASIVVALIK